MNELDKVGIFKKFGFDTLPNMPCIDFIGYTKVMNHCYQLGYETAITYSGLAELHKKVKDLEGKNNTLHQSNCDIQETLSSTEESNKVLRKRNHELQEDLEESLKEVDEYYKHNQALLQRNISLVGELSQLRKQMRNNSCTLENPPKSRVVVTVEEF